MKNEKLNLCHVYNAAKESYTSYYIKWYITALRKIRNVGGFTDTFLYKALELLNVPI